MEFLQLNNFFNGSEQLTANSRQETKNWNKEKRNKEHDKQQKQEQKEQDQQKRTIRKEQHREKSSANSKTRTLTHTRIKRKYTHVLNTNTYTHTHSGQINQISGVQLVLCSLHLSFSLNTRCWQISVNRALVAQPLRSVQQLRSSLSISLIHHKQPKHNQTALHAAVGHKYEHEYKNNHKQRTRKRKRMQNTIHATCYMLYATSMDGNYRYY